MFDTKGQWLPLETYDDFDNGLGELIDLWSSSASKALKESALTHFKEDLEAAILKWIDNRAKSKKYAAIAEELAEFEGVLTQNAVVKSSGIDAAVSANAKTKT